GRVVTSRSRARPATPVGGGEPPEPPPRPGSRIATVVLPPPVKADSEVDWARAPELAMLFALPEASTLPVKPELPTTTVLEKPTYSSSGAPTTMMPPPATKTVLPEKTPVKVPPAVAVPSMALLTALRLAVA